PGPNSTEMTMHVGFERAGVPGLLTSGACFIAPAVLLTGGLAWAYVEFGSAPQAAGILAGIQPAVIAVILGAVWRLGRPLLGDWRHPVLAALVIGVALAGLGELGSLALGALLGTPWLARRGAPAAPPAAFALPGLHGGGPATAMALGAAAAVPAGLLALFLFFLKVGAVLYGSGYVLVAFLEGGLVEGRQWLTQPQLLDAIGVGQTTPGPVLSTATWVGYVIRGWPGAVVATLGIFLPSFLFVGFLNPLIPRLRSSRITSAFLDAVNASALALMVVVTLRLGATTLGSPFAWTVASLSALLIVKWRVNAAWIVVGAGVLGAAFATAS
ncbi:MAG: chromate efflux transporter, partial [Gemmatimonadetes bacterium]|nr:chromate efflux transporter [Gemmatimonadota bacterium]